MPTPKSSPDSDIPLSPEQITAALATLPGWVCSNHTLKQTYTFSSFRAAIIFMHRASFIADEMDHHPDWSNNYDSVHIRLTTHHAGNNITAKDVALAREMERLAQSR